MVHMDLRPADSTVVRLVHWDIVCHARAAQVGVVNRTRREGEEMMLEATIVLLLGLTDIASL